MKLRQLLLAVACGCLGSGALAHGTEKHATPPVVDLPDEVTPLQWKLGGAFELIDHTGTTRTQIDPEGRMQLVFFGYANCPGICSAALPMMADAAEVLERRGISISPVLITIDPVLDTVETMGPALAEISADLIGLTGDHEALRKAHGAFQINFEKIMEDPEYGPIYAHSSHIFLLDQTGKVLTLLPPVLPTGQVADIVTKYAGN
jgi:protein SCO1